MKTINAVAKSAIDRLNMRAVAIAPAYAQVAERDLQTLATADQDAEKAASLAGRAELFAAFGIPGFNAQQQKPFAFADGVAIIPVTGMLLNRFGSSWGNYATGYNFIRSQMNAALADEDVKMIVFDVNSYGGEVSGCFELSDDIYAARGDKPLLAVVDANCYSAAYAVASAADKIIVTPSGGAGSIGVVAMHTSYQGYLEKEGIKITMIYSGDHKVDGNPYNDLPADVKANMQADVDASRMKFAELVARNRGLDVQAVIDTQAQTYRAEDAMKQGLIDMISPPSRAIASYTNELSDDSSESFTTENRMSGNAAAPGAESQSAQNVDTAKLAADARQAERARITAIKALPEAQGRAGLADHLALSTELSVEQAAGILGAAPKDGAAAAQAEPAANVATGAAAAAAQTAAVFEAAMEAGGNPKVGDVAAPADAAAAAGKRSAAAESILRAHAAATGRKIAD